jgi:hypothetical protein
MSEAALLPPELPWPTFADGQRLEARHLNDLQAVLVGLQRWHNRTLHGWGVAAGLTVRAQGKDARQVVVSPGGAVDVEGRELFVCSAVTLPVPLIPPGCGTAKVTDWWLTAHYHDAKGEAVPQEGCGYCGEVRQVLPLAKVRWHDPDARQEGNRLRPGLDLVLARVTVDRGRAIRITDQGRREAVPPSRPRIATGRGPVKGHYAWWPLPADADQTIPFQSNPPDTRLAQQPGTASLAVLVLVTVQDTFVTTPAYVVQLQGSTLRPSREAAGDRMVVGSATVLVAKPSYFWAVITLWPLKKEGSDWVPNKPGTWPPTEVDVIKEIIEGWNVVWFGIEG